MGVRTHDLFLAIIAALGISLSIIFITENPAKEFLHPEFYDRAAFVGTCQFIMLFTMINNKIYYLLIYSVICLIIPFIAQYFYT